MSASAIGFDPVIALPARLCGGDIVCSRSLRKTLGENLSNGKRNFLLDASALKFIDSAGVGLLIQISAEGEKAGGSIGLSNVSREIFDFLELTGVADLLKFDSSNSAGVLSFASEIETADDSVAFRVSGNIVIAKLRDGIRNFADKCGIRRKVLTLLPSCERILWDLSGIERLDGSTCAEIAKLSLFAVESRVRMDVCNAIPLIREQLTINVHSLSFFPDLNSAFGEKPTHNSDLDRDERVGHRRAT